MSKMPKAVIDRLKLVAGKEYSDIIINVYNLGREEGFKDAISCLKLSLARHAELNRLGDENYIEEQIEPEL